MKRFEEFNAYEIYQNLNMNDIKWFNRKFNYLYSNFYFKEKREVVIYLIIFIF